MDAQLNGMQHNAGESSPEEDRFTEDTPTATPFRHISSPRRSSAPPLPPLCPASLLLQAAAGLEAMNSYRAVVAVAGGGSTPTSAALTSPIAPPTPIVSSPSPSTPQQQQHRGPQPISPPPPSPQISAAELSLLTEASATTNGTFQCTLCSKQFGYKNGLIRHVRLTHVGEKPYQCTICNRRFGYKHILMEHQNLHFGNRPYACALCDKRFAARSNLIQHRMVHRRPFTCSLCPKRFDREDQLKKHLFAHPQSHLPPGNGCAADQSSTAGLERAAKRRRTSSSVAAGAATNSDEPGSSPPSQVFGRSGSVTEYGTEDDQSAGRPFDDDDEESNVSRGSSLSPDLADYAKPPVGLVATAASLVNSSKIQLPAGLSGHRIDAICNQLSSHQSGPLACGNYELGSSINQHHHQRHHSHHHHHQQQQQQQQQLLGGLFPGVVVKKETIDVGDSAFDHYGGGRMPLELSGARRLSSSRSSGSSRQNGGVEADVDKASIHHVGHSSLSSAQYPLTSFAAWSSPVARNSSSSMLVSSDLPLTATICSSSSSNLSALPGIHEVFSRRLANNSSLPPAVQKLPSFANFMPPAHPTQTASHPPSVAPLDNSTVGSHSSYRASTTLPDLGLSLLHSPSVPAPIPAGSLSHQSSNGTGSLPQQQQQQQSGVVNPTPRPTAQLPPIALQPLPSTTSTPPRPTKDQGVQHSQSIAGFPSLDDVLSYYVSQGRLFRCQHCSILFFERGMFFLHASLHGLNSPWECSICHRVCSDKNEFTLHFVNQQHNC